MQGINFSTAGTLPIESHMTEEEKWKFYPNVWKNYMVWLVLYSLFSRA